MAAPQPARSLEDMCGDGTTTVSDFFATWNIDLPPMLVARNERICHDFLHIHGRTQFSSWFKLTSTQADAVCNGHMGKDEGEDGTAWRKTIETMAGFNFAKPAAPESFELVQLSNKRKGITTKDVRPRKKPTTVASRLLASGKLTGATLPEACYDVIETEDPLVETIKEPEVHAFTTEVAEYIACEYGDWSIGRQLARTYGKQAKKRLPNLPDRGLTLGRNRDLSRMIFHKCKNLMYVRCCRSNRTRTTLPALPHKLRTRTTLPTLLSLLTRFRCSRF